MNVVRSQSQTHQNYPELKPKLAQTRSCPNGSSKVRKSESSVRSTSSTYPKLPPNFRHGSVAGTASIASSVLPTDLENNAFESTTSSSLFHGIVLITIMVSSLIAFVCSKIKRPCDSHSDSLMTDTNDDCSVPIVLFFSVITIISCLLSFIIYFLHLIGQCDVSWLAKRRFIIEIFIISTMAILLVISNSLMVIDTQVLSNEIGIISIVSSSVSVVGYGIRMAKLCTECMYFSKTRNQDSKHENKIDENALTLMRETLKNKLNGETSKCWEVNDNNTGSSSSSNHPNTASAMRVISYVKRKRSVESTIKSTANQPNGTNHNINDYDVDSDDDVFIQ